METGSDNQEASAKLQTRFFYKATIGLIGEKLRDHLITSKVKNFTKELLESEVKKHRPKKLKLEHSASQHFKDGSLSPTSKSAQAFAGRNRLRHLTSSAVREILANDKNQTVSTPGSPRKKKKKDNWNMIISSMRKGQLDGAKALRFTNEGVPHRELEKQRAAAIQIEKEKAKAYRTFRRKSCHCSDCGGRSKFEAKTEHIIASIKKPKSPEVPVVKKKRVQPSSAKLLTLPKHQDQLLSLFKTESVPNSARSVKSPGILKMHESAKFLLSEQRKLLSDKVLTITEGSSAQGAKRGIKIEQRDPVTSGDGPYKVRVFNTEEVDLMVQESLRKEGFKTEKTEPEEGGKKQLKIKKKSGSQTTRHKYTTSEPISHVVEAIEERMKNLGLLKLDKKPDPKQLRKFVITPGDRQTKINARLRETKKSTEPSQEIRLISNTNSEFSKELEKIDKENIGKNPVIAKLESSYSINVKTEIPETKDSEDLRSPTTTHTSNPVTPRKAGSSVNKDGGLSMYAKSSQRIRNLKPLSSYDASGLSGITSTSSIKAGPKAKNPALKLDLKNLFTTQKSSPVMHTDRDIDYAPKLGHKMTKSVLPKVGNKEDCFSLPKETSSEKLVFKIKAKNELAEIKNDLDSCRLTTLGGFRSTSLTTRATEPTFQPILNNNGDIARVYTSHQRLRSLQNK